MYIGLSFTYSSNIVLHSAHRDMLETMRSNTAELRDLLHNALTVRSETQQIIDLQNAGQPVAQQFMAAGQRVKKISFNFAFLNILWWLRNCSFSVKIHFLEIMHQYPKHHPL